MIEKKMSGGKSSDLPKKKDDNDKKGKPNDEESGKKSVPKS